MSSSVVHSFYYAPPPHNPVKFKTPGVGAHGWVRSASHGGVIQSRGWLPKVEAFDTLGTQPPLSDAVVNSN